MASETTSFPKMGDSLESNVIDVSGNRSPYGKMGKSGVNTATGGSEGPKGNKSVGANAPSAASSSPSIQAKIVYSNDPNEGLTLRNVKKVSGGKSGFYSARSNAGNTGNV